MKQQRQLFLLASAAFLIAACSADGDGRQDEILLRATMPAQPLATDTAVRPQTADTRAADGLMTAFAGEKAYIYISDFGTTTKVHGAAHAITGTKVDGMTGVYYPPTGNNVNIKAYFPYEPTYDTSVKVDNGSTSFSVKTDQSSANAYKASDLMFAKVDNAARQTDAHTLTFHHQLSKFVVNVKSDGSITEKFKVELLNVLPSVTFTAETMDNMTASGDAVTVTMASTETTGDLSTTTQTYAAVIPPQTVAASATPSAPVGFLRITLESGGTCTYSLTEATEFKAATTYTYTATMGLYGIEIATDIAPWDGSGGTSLDNYGSGSLTTNAPSTGTSTAIIRWQNTDTELRNDGTATLTNE